MKIIPRTHALRLLLAQATTGGIIDVDRNFRVSVDRAHQIGLIPDDIREDLIKEELPEFRGFLDNNSGENLTYRELLKRTLPDEIHGMPMYVSREGSRSDSAKLKDSSRLSLATLTGGNLSCLFIFATFMMN